MLKTTRLEKFGRFTVVEVEDTVELGNKIKTYRGVGIARQSDDDWFDKTKAEKIATGRAIKALGKNMSHKRINNLFMG